MTDWLGPEEGWTEIGSDVQIRFISGRDPDEEVGIIERHKKATGEFCCGSVFWKRYEGDSGPVWTLEQREPLTLSPSILCKTCGHHGFIKEGRWTP